MAILVAKQVRTRRFERTVGILAGSLLAVSVAIGGWDLLRMHRIQAQLLPSGGLASLVGATYGKQHACTVGSGWEKLVSKFLPKRGDIGAIRASQFTPTDSLLVWWLIESPQNSRGLASPGYNTVMDEHGCRFSRTQSTWLPSWNIEKTVIADQLSVFPRRSPTFELGIINSWNRQAVAKFTVRNPKWANYPVWSTDPYPLRQKNGRFALALLGMAHNQNRIVQRSGVQYRLAENGKPTDQWMLATATTSDATGNRITSSIQKFGKDERAWFDGLCTQEAAWKLRFQLMPTYPVRAKPDFTGEVRDLALPQPGRPIIKGQRFGDKDTEVQFLELMDNHDRGEREATARMASIAAHVRVWRAEQGACVSLVRVEDERGRDLSDRVQGKPFSGLDGGASQLLPPDRTDLFFNIRPPEGVKRLNLTFAVHKSHPMEFLAKP